MKQEYDIDKFNVNLQCRKKLVADVIKIYNERDLIFESFFNPQTDAYPTGISS
ncbi:hypothetical protein CCAN2_700001 [Capnocytophaga canimorsus]|nr:hypothetical protein CCAN2_700001 [Capnocytophaga canimorsus]